VTARRKLAAAGLAVLLASILTAAVMLVHVDGWRDITIGTGTSYCGVAIRHVSAEFYCQDGH
jgi:hypothetical protein